MDRFADEKIAPRTGLMTVFLIRKPCPCQSVADLVRSGNVFMDIFLPRKRQRCKGCHKDIQVGYTDNKDTHG